MADGTVTYIGFYDDWENCGWAFRVWEREVITGVSVSVNPLSEIEVTETLMEDYDPDVLHFEVNDSTTYDSYEWYLDDVKDTNSTSTVFNVELGSNLTPGVHTVMLIAKKGSKYYSYTAQFWKD